MNRTATETAVAAPQNQQSAFTPFKVVAIPAHMWILVVSLTVGGALRFYQLGAKGLWGDEIWTAQWSQGALGQVWIALTRIPDMPLMYALVNISTRFGESELWVRLPSALFGVAGILMFYVLANRLLGQRPALAGVVLMIFSPIHIWYSQDARYYTQLCFLGMASVYFFYAFLTSDQVRPGLWLGYLLSTTAALYTHLFAGWILLAQGMFVAYVLLDQALRTGKATQVPLAVNRTKALWMTGALLVLAILTFPIALRLVETLQTGISAGGEGMARLRFPPAWPDFLTVAFLSEVVQRFSGGSLAIMLLPLFFLVGAVTTWRSARSVGVLVLCLFCAPFLTAFFLELRHGIGFKYFFYLLPFFLLLAAQGIAWTASKLAQGMRMRNKRTSSNEAHSPFRPHLRTAAVFLVLLVGVGLMYAQPIGLVYRQARINDWRSIATYLSKNLQPGDVVYTERWGRNALAYYLQPISDVAVVESTQEGWQRMGLQASRAWLVGLRGEFEREAQGSLQRVADSEWQDSRWLYALPEQSSLPYPVTEPQATIYVVTQTTTSPIVDFADIDSADWTDVTYRHVAPGGQTSVDLTLPSVAPRTLTVRYLDYPGKDYQVSVDGQALASVTGGISEGWQIWQSQLPETSGDTVRIAIAATGSDAIGIDSVELAFTSPPPNLAVMNDGVDVAFAIEDQGVVVFEDAQNTDPATEAHRRLNPGDDIKVELSIPDQSGRILTITAADLPNQSLAVEVNGYLLGVIAGSNRSNTWIEEHFYVPSGIGAHALIQIRALGPEASTIYSLAVEPF